MRSFLITAGILSLTFMGCPTLFAESNVVKIEEDSSDPINCQCIKKQPGCEGQLMSGNVEKRSWSQSVHVHKGTEIDVSLLCWQNRDIKKQGEGLCCSLSNSKKDVRFFLGEMSNRTKK